MNAIPGKYSGWLASLFLLVHSVGHDERTWVLLFSLAYFNHKRDGNEHKAHTMDGIVIGCSPTSNALMVYNPCSKKYYEPDVIAWTHTVSLAQPTPPSSKMAVCLSASYVTTIPS